MKMLAQTTSASGTGNSRHFGAELPISVGIEAAVTQGPSLFQYSESGLKRNRPSC